MSDAIERLAAHLVETPFERMSLDAITAKTFILDTFGVAIAGTTGPRARTHLDSKGGGATRPHRFGAFASDCPHRKRRW